MTLHPRAQTVAVEDKDKRAEQQPLPELEAPSGADEPEGVTVYVIVPRNYLDDVIVAGGFRPEIVYEIAPKLNTTDAVLDAFRPSGEASRRESTRLYPMSREFALEQDARMGAVARVSLLPDTAVRDFIYVIGLYEKMVKAQGGAIGVSRSELESMAERYWKSPGVPVETFSRYFVENPAAYHIRGERGAALVAVRGEVNMELWLGRPSIPDDARIRNLAAAIFGRENLEHGFTQNIVPEILLPEGYTPAMAVVRP